MSITSNRAEEMAKVLAERHRILVRFRTYPIAHCLGALVVTFLLAPLYQLLPEGNVIEGVLMTAVLLCALMALGGRKRTLFIGMVLITPALAGTWTTRLAPGALPERFVLACALLFVGFVVAQLLRFIQRAPWINSEVLCAGVTTYLMLALLWALAYMIVERSVPDAFVFTVEHIERQFKGLTALYFSFVTLCTLGYGDIVPAVPIARTLAMMEAMTGTLYLAILVARLVSLYSVRNAGRSPSGLESEAFRDKDASD
jgi:hypothetical protein